MVTAKDKRNSLSVYRSSSLSLHKRSSFSLTHQDTSSLFNSGRNYRQKQFFLSCMEVLLFLVYRSTSLSNMPGYQQFFQHTVVTAKDKPPQTRSTPNQCALRGGSWKRRRRRSGWEKWSVGRRRKRWRWGQHAYDWAVCKLWYQGMCVASLQHSATQCNTLQHTATHCNTHYGVRVWEQSSRLISLIMHI